MFHLSGKYPEGDGVLLAFYFFSILKDLIRFPGIDQEGEVAYISIIIKLVLLELIF